MRILFTTLKTDNLVNLNVLYHLEKEVGDLVDCKWSGEGWSEHKPGEPLYGNDPPDWVVSNRPNLEEYGRLSSLNRDKSYKVATTIADLHVHPRKWIKAINSGSDATFMRYLYSPMVRRLPWLKPIRYYGKLDPDHYQKELTTKVFHLPWFVDPSLYDSTEEEKEYDVVFLGSYDRSVYPLRYDLVQKLPKICEEKGWKLLLGARPPGRTTERRIDELAGQGYPVGRRYAEILSRCKIFIFGSSIFKYPVSKYFESMACGALVMADEPQSADALHFAPGWNFVEINRDDWVRKLDYYLSDDEEREKIAGRGHETVMRYHTARVRAQQLVSNLKSVQEVGYGDD
jgi:glycosyltransferase involved in cell wall biosynthesis